MTAEQSESSVGLIGVGTMGILVVSALIDAGYTVLVHDVNRDTLLNAKGLGAIAVEHPRDVALGSDIILLLLPGPPQIEEVVDRENGVLSVFGSRKTIIDMSTVDPATTRRMGVLANEVGVDYIDAPILGRPRSFGQWVLPVGGDGQVLEKCRPILSKLAKSIIHVGPLGAGNTLKLLNALMFSAINAMTAEMMAISMKAGLSPRVLFETISASQAATVSGLFKEVGAKIVARDFDPVFPIHLLCKDSGLAIEMAREFGAPPILASSIQVLNELARARGLGSEDTSALVKLYETILDIEPVDSSTDRID